MIGNLKYWNNGTPILPDEELGNLKYWISGEVYIVYTAGGGLKKLDDSIFIQESLSNAIGLVLGDSLDINENISVVKIILINIDDDIEIEDILSKDLSTKLSDSLAILETLKISNFYVLEIFDILTTTEDIDKVIGLIFSENIDITEEEAIAIGKPLTDVLTISEVFKTDKIIFYSSKERQVLLTDSDKFQSVSIKGDRQTLKTKEIIR